METKTNLATWLEDKLRSDHLSLRQAGTRAGLSHATIADIRNGVRPDPETVKKLARAFGARANEILALEDYLLTLAGYRTPRPEGAELSVAAATLMDKVSKFNDSQLGIMTQFADFLRDKEEENGL